MTHSVPPAQSKQVLYVEVCQNLSQICDEAIATGEPIEIIREGSESVSLISTAELSSLLETVYLFQSHRNATRLLDALQRAQAETNTPTTVESLRQEFGLVEERTLFGHVD
jgi:antitoxin YefM